MPALSEAEIITLPVIITMHSTPDAIEQRDREWAARFNELNEKPYRTRPLLVVDNEKAFSR